MSGNNRSNWEQGSWPVDALPLDHRERQGQETASSSAGGGKGYWDPVKGDWTATNTSTSSAAPYTHNAEEAYYAQAAHNTQAAYNSQAAYNTQGSTGQVHGPPPAWNSANAPANANTAYGTALADDNSYYLPVEKRSHYQQPAAAAPYDPRYAGSSAAASAADSANYDNTDSASAPAELVKITSVWKRTLDPQDPAYQYPNRANTVTALSRSVDKSVESRRQIGLRGRFQDFEQELDEYAEAVGRVGQWIGWRCKVCKGEGKECRNNGSFPNQPCERCAELGLHLCYDIEVLPNEASNWRAKPENKNRQKYDQKMHKVREKFMKIEKSRQAAEEVLKARWQKEEAKRLAEEEATKRRNDRAGTGGSGSSGREGKGGGHKRHKA